MTKVLIVEDNPTVTSLYRNTLRVAGFTVQVAADGHAGLEAMASFAPDAVLLDLMLPGMDGVTLLRTLRADNRFATTPVIVFSNSYTNQRLEEVWDAGATQVLAKASSTPKQVVEAIKAAIGERR